MSKCSTEKKKNCKKKGKICNPASGRCVTKDGKIGKQVIAANVIG